MYDGSILYIYFVAYADAVNVSAYNGIEPDAAIVTHRNITYNSCVRCEKAIFTKHRDLTFHRKNYRHKIVVYLGGNFPAQVMDTRALFFQHVAQTSASP